MKNLILIALAIFLVSCQKTEIPNAPSPEYISWAEGDWWVYEWKRYDHNLGETTTLSTDTIFALPDATINGHNYRTLSSGFYPWQHDQLHLRDSAGYVVDEFGEVWFSTVNFSDTIQNSVDAGYHIFSMMIEDSEPTEVLAGSFTTINHQTTGIPPEGTQYPCGESIILSDRQFADEIGLVRLSYHYAAPGPCIENTRELKEYHQE